MALQAAKHSFIFEIAGLRLALYGPDTTSLHQLACRYRRFRSLGPPHLEVEIETVGQMSTATEEARGENTPSEQAMHFDGGVLRFAAGGYEGEVDVAQGRAWQHLSSVDPLEDIEYFLRVCTALLAFEHGSVLLHAAGLRRGGQGYAFFGPSGSGKTTVARLSPDAEVLNDDLVLLQQEQGQWHVHGTPFWNPTQVRPGKVTHAPLRALYHLVQDREVYLEPLPKAKALARLIASTPLIAAHPERLPRLLDLHQRLLAEVPVCDLHFRPDPSFWALIDHDGIAD
ncbi:MAG: hypothetical protein QHJ81_15555 [Anaerolineae bacterium]|nr:hypothetical protein [Anaerolineae bacterium]